MHIHLELVPENERGTMPSELAFGAAFSDHMFTQEFQIDKGWHNAQIGPVQPFSLHPAAAVLHYGQEVFEGLKAYRAKDGRILLFRPQENAARFNRSAVRINMPVVDEADHVEAIKRLVEIDQRWVPQESGSSLYIRPAMIATTPKLGLASATNFLHFIITSPVAAYFDGGLAPISVFVSDERRRAVVGGVGEAKTGGNYAASLLASEEAAKQGFSQVLWLDAIEGRFVEEVGAMNICFVYRDGSIVTPSLSGSILPGITRDSVIKLAPKIGHEVSEQRLDINQILEDIKTGHITEAFGCGTAAVISPVNRLSFKGDDYCIGNGNTGSVSQKFFDTLTGIQYGEIDDPFDWVVDV